jgi:hypothetical protein
MCFDWDSLSSEPETCVHRANTKHNGGGTSSRVFPMLLLIPRIVICFVLKAISERSITISLFLIMCLFVPFAAALLEAQMAMSAFNIGILDFLTGVIAFWLCVCCLKLWTLGVCVVRTQRCGSGGQGETGNAYKGIAMSISQDSCALRYMGSEYGGLNIITGIGLGNLAKKVKKAPYSETISGRFSLKEFFLWPFLRDFTVFAVKL